MSALAMRSLLSATIANGAVLWTAGRLFADYTRETPVLLDPKTGSELRADAPPAFVLSTDGEAEDGNILEQEWDTSRSTDGICPILVNHRLNPGSELGIGQWRNARVADVSGAPLANGGKRWLLADADFDQEDPMGQRALSKVRRAYLRSVSVGWRPGGRMLRGDLPKDHPRYRAPLTDECGMRIEGYTMGTQGDPNRLVESSVTPIPCDPMASTWDGRTAEATRQLGELARGESVKGVDLRSILLLLRENPGVKAWGQRLIFSALETTEGRAALKRLLASESLPPTAARSVGNLLRSA